MIDAIVGFGPRKYVETYNQDLAYLNSYKNHQANKSRSKQIKEGDKQFMW
jgi:hypothetical protein